VLRAAGTLTATQRCSGGSRCSPALVWSTCLDFDSNLAVRRDVAMSSAVPASALASGTNDRDDRGCHCDLPGPGSVYRATGWRLLGFGTIRAVAGA